MSTRRLPHGSVCANGAEPIVDGMLDASAFADYTLINLRAEGDPQTLADAVSSCLASLRGALALVDQEAFTPPPPRRERRLPPQA